MGKPVNPGVDRRVDGVAEFDHQALLAGGEHSHLVHFSSGGSHYSPGFPWIHRRVFTAGRIKGKQYGCLGKEQTGRRDGGSRTASQSWEALHARARVLEGIRGFFRERGFLEVDPPIAQKYPNIDPNIFPVKIADASGRAARFYLHTSPNRR